MKVQKINEKGLQIIKDFEGCSLTSYLCPAGIWTIAVGHTGKEVGPDQAITHEHAVNLLLNDVARFEACVIDACKVELTSNQFSACVCLCFNIGTQAFRNSTLLKKINDADIANCYQEFLKWNKITVNGEKKELEGLTRRRKAEAELFIS